MANEISTASRMINSEMIANIALSAYKSQPQRIQDQLIISKSEQTFSGILANAMYSYSPLCLGDSENWYSGHVLLEFKGTDYNRKTSKGIKKSRNFHDISILNHNGEIGVIIENKFWYHFDGCKGKKKPKPEKGIGEQLEGDILKIRQTLDKSLQGQKGFILVNVVSPSDFSQIPASYLKDHRSAFARANQNLEEYRKQSLFGFNSTFESFENQFEEIFHVGTSFDKTGNFLDFFCAEILL